MTPLRRRLFLLSTASIVPLAILATFGIRTLRAQHGQEVQRIGQELSRSIANSVDAELRTAIASLNTLSTATSLQQGDLDTFSQRLALLLPQRPGWLGVIVSAPDGQTLLDSSGTIAGEAALQLAAGVRASVAAGGPHVGNLARDSRGRWYFPVQTPMAFDAPPRYVLSAIISAEVIREVVARQRVPADWVISIIDSTNLRIARSRAHDANVGGELSASAQEVLAAGGAEGFGVSTSLEGERIYTPYSRLANGWAAVLGLPTAQAEAAGQDALAVYGGGLVLSIVLGLLGAAWVGRTITRPIAALRDSASAMGLPTRPAPPVTDIREIREVGAALVLTAEKLRRHEAERDAALDRERAARQAAESADRAKDEFLGILSHELRTPLNAVYGWARMLQTGELRDDAARARARDAIVRNAAIQMQMIDDLLDMSRITSGKMRIDLRETDLAAVVNAAVEVVRPAAAARQIAVVTDVPAAVPPIAADAARLQQVFWNLLMNAVKFTGSGGQVHVALRVNAADLQVIIRDTGEGIEPDILPHIFERFRQGDSSITRPHGGLGLGLTIARHLAESHGGRVEAASPGRGMGATFTVTLGRTPFALTAASGASPGEAPLFTSNAAQAL